MGYDLVLLSRYRYDKRSTSADNFKASKFYSLLFLKTIIFELLSKNLTKRNILSNLAFKN